MKCFYSRFRIFLMMLALGLASVSFFNELCEKGVDVSLNLPQVQSDAPIYIVPYEFPEPETDVVRNKRLIQNRDLSIYEIGKTFSNCHVPNSEMKNCEQERVNAREFILNHWKAKKRAYIIYEWSGCDYGGSYHIFIEPDKNSKWHIILRTYSDSRYEIKLEETRGYSIKYKPATDKDYPFKIGTYILSVLDKNQEVIESF